VRRALPACLLAACVTATAQQSLPVVHQHNPSLPPFSSVIPLSAVWPQIDLNVFVLDRSGNPVQQTAPPLFQLLQDNAPHPIQSVVTPDSPLSLALLMDTSGSTRSEHAQAVAAATALISTLPRGSELMIVFFSDQAYCDLPFTPVASFDPSIWQHMEARGGTALYDALIATERYFIGHAHNPRRALVLISDGGENASNFSIQQAVGAIAVPGAPVLFALRTAADPNAPGANVSPQALDRDFRNLRKLTDAGGGIVVNAHRESDIPGAAARIAAMMNSQYALVYSADGVARDGGLHRIEVRLPPSGAKVAIYGQPAFYAPQN
jgi:VWFA-related protein